MNPRRLSTSEGRSACERLTKGSLRRFKQSLKLIKYLVPTWLPICQQRRMENGSPALISLLLQRHHRQQSQTERMRFQGPVAGAWPLSISTMAIFRTTISRTSTNDVRSLKAHSVLGAL